MPGFSDSVGGEDTGDRSRKRALAAHSSSLGLSPKAGVLDAPGVPCGSPQGGLSWFGSLALREASLRGPSLPTWRHRCLGKRRDALIALRVVHFLVRRSFREMDGKERFLSQKKANAQNCPILSKGYLNSLPSSCGCPAGCVRGHSHVQSLL